MTDSKNVTILMADDDEDDRLMAKEALEEAHLDNEIRFVENGEELLEYLHRQGKYSDPALSPRPALILLDLNMPLKGGIEALQDIKSSKELRKIPVVILTTSSAETDIIHSYDLGGNSFITKPVSFEGLVEVMKSLTHYWFHLVKLPPA